MPSIDQHILQYFAQHPNQGAGDIPPLDGHKIPRQTLSRRLHALVAQGKLLRTGQGAGSRYVHTDFDTYFQIPASLRPPASYQRMRGADALPRFTSSQLQALETAAGAHGSTAEDSARAVRERLMVEFSFASSSLEGNTYDLIQTETLIRYGQAAEGKTAFEAKMILNHGDAIRYLLDNITTVQIDWATLRDLHALLSDGLLDDAADSGRVRKRLVAITHSTYSPLDNEFQIREAIDVMLAAVNEEPQPFNRSLMLMTGIPYIQAFADCNKRTGRLMANLPLLMASLPPLSFITVDKEAYTRGLLGYYELGNGQLLAKAYADAYPASAAAYRTGTRPNLKSPEQMAMELRYQDFVRQRVRALILGQNEASAPLPASIPDEDHEAVSQMIRKQIETMHPGRAAPLGVTPADIEAYLQRTAAR